MWNGRRSISGPGFWNDLDNLMLGGKVQSGGGMALTWNEYRSQFSLWCILASPLIFSADIIQHYSSANVLTKEMRDIMMNREMTAINQDPLGKEGWRVSPPNPTGGEAWARALKDGNIAVALLNRRNTTITVEAWTWTLPAAGSGNEVARNKECLRRMGWHRLGKQVTWRLDECGSACHSCCDAGSHHCVKER